jgi:uncharacterized protein YfaS (alpha-2-macroglobulin family)
MSIPLQEFDLGDAPRAINKFRDFNGVLADPTTVMVKIRKPDGSIVTKPYPTDTEIVKDSTGIYHVDLSTDMAGQWTIRWEGTGTVKAAIEQRFTVRRSDFS